VRILAASDPALREKMLAYQAEIAAESRAKNATLTPPDEPPSA
jgi:hypothetical protein